MRGAEGARSRPSGGTLGATHADHLQRRRPSNFRMGVGPGQGRDEAAARESDADGRRKRITRAPALEEFMRRRTSPRDPAGGRPDPWTLMKATSGRVVHWLRVEASSGLVPTIDQL